jgi:hypothetical protein
MWVANLDAVDEALPSYEFERTARGVSGRSGRVHARGRTGGRDGGRRAVDLRGVRTAVRLDGDAHGDAGQEDDNCKDKQRK